MILAVFFAVAFSVIIFVLLKVFGSKGQFRQQKMISDRISVTTTSESPTLNLRKRSYISDVESLNRFLTKFNLSVHISDLLTMARLKFSVSVFFLVSLVMGGVVFILASRSMSTANALIAGITATPALYLYLVFKKKQYLKKFDEYFPNALNLLSSSLKVGHVLEAGIEAVASSAPFPISDEFKAVQAEIKLGMNLQQSLGNLYRRIGSPELKIFVAGVAINSELGGNLSEILDNIEKTIRERFALKREIDALSAQGKMSALVLFCLPFVMGLYMYSQNKADFIGFFSSKPGKMCIWLMIFTQLISFFGIKQAIKLQD